MASDLLKLHDKLLAEKPEGAIHEEATCPLCAFKLLSEEDNEELGGGSMSEPKTYTEAELQAAVDKAVSEASSKLEAKIAEFEGNQTKSEMDKAIAEAKAEAQKSIDELQGKLDAAVVEAATAKEEKEKVEAFWAEAIENDKKDKEVAARKEERLVKIREVASLPDDYLTEHGDRFAAMTDEDFAARLDEWKVIASQKSDETIPVKTIMTASRNETNENGSMLGEIANMRRTLIDPRTL